MNKKTLPTNKGLVEQSTTKSIFKKLKKIFSNKYILLFLGSTILISCGSDDGPGTEPQNQAPTVTLSNIVSNDATDTVTGKLTATDSDGTIAQKTLQAEATDGSKVNITLNSDGTFSHTLNATGKTYDTLLASAKDNDNATDETFTSLNPTITVEAPNVDSTVANPTNTVDENSTADIDMGIEDANGLASTVFKNASTNELNTYFEIIDNTKLRLKSGAVLNHEDDSQIQGEVTITDNLGNQVDKTITIDLNDLQEQQIIDIYGDGGLLPNGQPYAIKTDEEETGQTLPVMYYNHGSARRTAAQIESFVVSPPAGYSDAQTDISDLYTTGIGPEHGTGQDMVSFDGTTNEMVIHAADGSELARIDRLNYGKMMKRIMEITGITDSIQFVQNGTVLNTIWEDMIVLHTQHSTNLYIGFDKAIQNYLTT